MKNTARHLLVAMAAVVVSAGVANASPNPIIVPGAAPIGPGGVVSTNLDLNGNDLENPDDILHDASATDAAPRNLAITSQAPLHGIGATNNDGGNLCDIPASGNNDLTGVTKAGTAADTVVFYYCLSDCTCSSVTITEGDGTGGTYECDGAADDATCVANLIAAVEANATLGPITAAVTRVGETTMFYPEGAGLWLKVVPSDGVNTVVSRGTDGKKLIPTGTTGVPGMAFVGDDDTGLQWVTSGAFRLLSNGTAKIQIASEIALYGSLNAAGQRIYDSTAALNVGDSGATGHGLAAGDVILGDKLEVNGASYLDSTAAVADDFNVGADDGVCFSASNDATGAVDTCLERLAANVITISVGGVAGILAYRADARTIEDGGAGATNLNLTPTSNLVTLTCNDADGCTIAPQEAGIQTGHRLTVVNLAANTCTVSDAANVTELAGGAAAALGINDTLELVYSGAAWVEVGRADN